MNNIHFNISATIFFIIISLSIMSKNVFASENGKSESFFDSCPEAKMALVRDEIDKKINSAIYSIAANTDVDSAISVLEEAASLGKDKAMYHLGWFYMGGIPDRLDKDRATHISSKPKDLTNYLQKSLLPFCMPKVLLRLKRI